MRARSTTSVRRNRATGPAGVPTTPANQFPPMGSHNPQFSRIGAFLPVAHRHLPGLSRSGFFFTRSPRRFPLQAVVAAGRSVWAMAGGVTIHPAGDASNFTGTTRQLQPGSDLARHPTKSNPTVSVCPSHAWEHRRGYGREAVNVCRREGNASRTTG